MIAIVLDVVACLLGCVVRAHRHPLPSRAELEAMCDRMDAINAERARCSAG